MCKSNYVVCIDDHWPHGDLCSLVDSDKISADKNSSGQKLHGHKLHQTKAPRT